MVPNFVTFGSALRYFRTRRQLTQNELARAVGYSREQVNHLESGRRRPDPIAVAALFVPALHLEQEPKLAAHLVSLAEAGTVEPNVLAGVADSESAPSESDVETTLPTSHMDETQQAYHRERAEIAQLVQGDVLASAHHYMLAGDLTRAVDVLADKGTALAAQEQTELATTLIDELLIHIRANLHQSGGKDLLRRLLVVRGDTLISTVRSAEADANYEEALSLSTNGVKADISYRLATALIQRARPQQALELVRAALQDIDPTYMILRANLRLVEGGALLALSRVEEAEAPTLEAFNLSDSLLPTMPMIANGLRARAGNSLGVIYAHRQQLETAINFWEAAYSSAALTHLRPLTARFRGNIANALFELGRLEEAAIACNEAIDGLLAINDAVGASKFMHLRASLLYNFGQFETALTQIDAACEIKTKIGDKASVWMSILQRVKILLALGRMTEVDQSLHEYLPQVHALDNPRLKIGWLLLNCEWELLQNRPDSAVACARTALELAATGHLSKEVQDAQTHLGVALTLNGDFDMALPLLQLPDEAALQIEVRLERLLAVTVLQIPHQDPHQTHELINSVIEQATSAHYTIFALRAEHILRRLPAWSDEQIAEVLYGTI